MMRRSLLLFRLFLVFLAALALDSSADRWEDLGQFAQALEALPPSPAGDGHLGLIDSGQWLALRFAVPHGPVEGYWLGLGNIVAYTGRGSSYQLLVRRDAVDGPVVYQGPVIPNGDQWNAANTKPVDLTEFLTAEDRERGYLNVFVTGLVEGDGWTLYRNNPGRPVVAWAAELTPEVRERMAAMRVMRERAISVLPIPRRVQLQDGDFLLTPETRIVYPSQGPASLASAAQELRDMIAERTGLMLQVQAAEGARLGHINLGLMDWGFWGSQLPVDQRPQGAEGYVVFNLSDGDGAMIVGGGEAGCFYGAMTVGQMTRRTDAGAAIPFCTIWDAPAFPHRIIQYDIARGQTVNVEYVKRMIRELARCKVNGLLFYMEDDFRFRRYPFLGREGTFTHEKARELDAYARRYHVQLIPQFEALGHASAVLSHEELKELREAGDPWVFCTSNPATWEFLDHVFAELAEAFPSSPYIHVGGDEFEFNFGKCERCRARIAVDGVGGLYAEHMNRLNQLVKKHGKVMLFWPSHWGPTPELTNMTLQYQDRLEKDCIPTEWIYHGPASYPSIEQYQQAGFTDVFCCPAVESYSRIWPDHVTTFRGIRGFYQAGEARGCGGAYCTTWEFMLGALVENSWYGLLYAAECSWSPASTPRRDYDRRFADIWWGLTGDEATARIDDTIFEPVPAEPPASMWRDRMLVRRMLWCEPERVAREFLAKEPRVGQNADSLVTVMDEALARLAWLAAGVRRNQLTLDAASLAFRMMRYSGHKVVTFREASSAYAEAKALLTQDADAAVAKLERIADALLKLEGAARELADGYRTFVDNCGAWQGDWSALVRQGQQLANLARQITVLADEVRGGKWSLPPAAEFGLLQGTYTRLGEWAPDQMSETGTELRFDITGILQGPQPLEVEWEYTSGMHGLKISATQLVCNGQVISEDVHDGWAGAGSRHNTYRLTLQDFDPQANYQIVGKVASAGGTDSRGTVWLLRP